MSHLYVSKFQHTPYDFRGNISYFTQKNNNSNYFGMTNNIGTLKLAFKI